MGGVTHIHNGLRALEQGDWQLAEREISRALEVDSGNVDAGYLLGMLAFRRDDHSGALRLFSSAKQTRTPPSPEFFARLGSVMEAFGADTGDSLHRFLQRHRLLPAQAIGQLAAQANWQETEPWSYVKEATRFFPKDQVEFDEEQELIEKYVLQGWLPSSPPFRYHSQLLTIGSCFAQNLRNFLAEKQLLSDWFFVPPGLNNTFALRHFIDWCATGNRAGDAFWYDMHADGGAVKWEPEAEFQRYREVFETLDGLVLTVGLAEVWYDAPTGGVFWRGVPKSVYDPSRHRCRVSTVTENRENIRHVIAALRSMRPGITIVLTLSPVPLKATFGERSIMAADCVSKSILRVAIDDVMAEGIPGVHYWPSFEIVRWLGAHFGFSLFGEDGNTRHVNRKTVRLVVESFIKHYFEL